MDITVTKVDIVKLPGWCRDNCKKAFRLPPNTDASVGRLRGDLR